MSEEINEEIKNLVIARLETIPSNKQISIGSMGDFSKEQLIQGVREGTDVGKKIIEIEMEFLRAFKSGIIA